MKLLSRYPFYALHDLNSLQTPFVQLQNDTANALECSFVTYFLFKPICFSLRYFYWNSWPKKCIQFLFFTILTSDSFNSKALHSNSIISLGHNHIFSTHTQWNLSSEASTNAVILCIASISVYRMILFRLQDMNCFSNLMVVGDWVGEMSHHLGLNVLHKFSMEHSFSIWTLSFSSITFFRRICLWFSLWIKVKQHAA